MTKNPTLYDKALSNYGCAKMLRDNLNDDDNLLNIIGYHLQQSLEMMIKHLLERSGIEYPKTHDIDQLIRIANEGKVNLYLNEYIKEHSEMFSQWESKSIYVLGYLIELSKIDRSLIELDKYFQDVYRELN